MFEQLTVKAADIQAFGVKCGNEVYVYLFNPSNSTIMTDVVIDLPGAYGRYKGESFEPTMRIYDPVRNIEEAAGEISLKNEILGSSARLFIFLHRNNRNIIKG